MIHINIGIPNNLYFRKFGVYVPWWSVSLHVYVCVCVQVYVKVCVCMYTHTHAHACIHDSFESWMYSWIICLFSGIFWEESRRCVLTDFWHHHLETSCFQLRVSAVGYGYLTLLRKSRTQWPTCWLQFCNGNNGSGVFIIKWFGKMHLGCAVGKTHSTLT